MVINQSPPVLETERHPKLKGVLRNYVETISRIVARFDSLTLQSGVFHFLLIPWIEPFIDKADTQLSEQRRQEFKSIGFDGDLVIRELEEILNGDTHLRECCDNKVAILALYLSESFIDPVAQWHKDGTVTDEQFEQLFNRFASTTYQHRFTKLVASHLYNFDSDQDQIDLGEVSLIRLDRSFIPRLLGESTEYSRLHRPEVGQFFLVTKQVGFCEDLSQWFDEERNKAHEFVRILQYFKDGVIQTDYSVPYFQPSWVNRLKRDGVSFYGDIRRELYANGNNLYHLSSPETERLKQWWQIYQLPEVVKRMSDYRNKLRQAIMRAGDNYETSHSRKDTPSKLGDLIRVVAMG